MFKRLFKRFKKTKKSKSGTDHADYAAEEPEPKDSIEEEKRTLSDSIEYLKSCDDFDSEKAFNAINYLLVFCWSMTSGEKYEAFCSILVDFLLNQGLAEVIVKILRSTTDMTSEYKYESRHLLQLIIKLCKYCVKEPNTGSRITIALVKSGIVPTLLEDLDFCNFDVNDPRQLVRILDDIDGLITLVNTPNITSIYRSGNAVPILRKFVQANDPMAKVLSLSVLCEIVNEEESQILATTGNCMATMVDAIQKASKSDDRRYSVAVEVDDSDPDEFTVGLKLLLYDTHKLAINDANKEAIVKHGGVPVLTAILRPDYTDNEKQAAIGVLQKLASLESNCDVVKTHVTATDKEALQGNYKRVTDIACFHNMFNKFKRYLHDSGDVMDAW